MKEEQKGTERNNGRDGGAGERKKEGEEKRGRVLRSSMQVLIKRIQKRGASSLCVEMWERVTWGGGLTSPPPLPFPTSCPASFLPCFHLFAPEPPRCTRAPRHQDESSGQCEEEDWVALNSLPHSPQIPSPWPPQPEPACPAAYDKGGGAVIDFISTLMRLLGLSLSLLQVGVKGLWGSPQEPRLRFSHRVSSQREKSHQQDPLGAVPSSDHVLVTISLFPSALAATLLISLVGKPENTLWSVTHSP